MCGVVGAINTHSVVNSLMSGLQSMEYRGYDSAGVALFTEAGIQDRRAAGKLRNLESLLASSPVDGHAGIAHTRWATHGGPSEQNAHPHSTDQVSVVHNGIIENFRDLKDQLTAAGHVFKSETDTEVVPVLITDLLSKGLSPEAAVEAALKQLEGAFALGIMFRGERDFIMAARRGSPLVLGNGKDTSFLASDPMAIAECADTVTFLEEDDWAILTSDKLEIRDAAGNEVIRQSKSTDGLSALADKNGYQHFMLKEIHEQPAVIRRAVGGLRNSVGNVEIPVLPFSFQDINRLTIVACGTSFYAGSVAKYWFEQIAKLPVDVDIASEFRYRGAPLEQGNAAVFISQSGETADTLAALRHAKNENQHILSLVNVPESSVARESDVVIETHAGPEIGVASTKAFTTQLTALGMLAVAAGRERGHLSPNEAHEYVAALNAVSSHAETFLNKKMFGDDLVSELSKATSVLFMGRGASYPIAMEGALKLKEISYIHAEGYGAGELKHGPIALVDQNLPVVVVAPHDQLFDKTLSNLQEVKARGARVILVSDDKGIKAAAGDAEWTIEVPSSHEFVQPILSVLPLQLLAYHVALEKGTDVDQPRNLAKSVTVE